MIYETIVEEKIIYETIYEVIKEIVIERYPEYVNISGETIYVDKPLPPEMLLQHINIIDIQFIIFAGESVEFNGPPGSDGKTALTSQEKKTNESIINYFADELKEDDKEYFVIFHGHANMITGTQEEALELEILSTSRAAAAAEKLFSVYEYAGYGDPDVDLANRVTTKGYGGGRSISGSISSYSGLNRRVEAILFTIETDEVLSDLGR